ncbi:MAG: hypothetical protein A2V77_24860 [Anaeromyxobacter sp. RBG_16_69_14]|nr:MAG: hypothetical protein A2V77_24860 [Anaeromyxobacter sp. RBG_16_69_14]
MRSMRHQAACSALALMVVACRQGPEESGIAVGQSRTEPSAQHTPEDTGSKLTGDVSDTEGLVSELSGRVTDKAIVIDLAAGILFEFDKFELRPEAAPTLKKIARLIQQSGQGTVEVNGHTDAIGSDAYNVRLSEQRAAAVVEWLANKGGVAAGRLEAKGHGKSRPVAPNATGSGLDNPQGRERNRRVEVIIARQ